ncbi:hypothetical protein [Paenarthrobacter nicotinovorans]|uniref:hypothetical protein n=1 Tax=Paenarthrobacter nicotinovorans TaxID=29320 RepID=UPI0007E7D272|nr:hypothetical protein [Paenarthrobacter nicotinovorans]
MEAFLALALQGKGVRNQGTLKVQHGSGWRSTKYKPEADAFSPEQLNQVTRSLGFRPMSEWVILDNGHAAAVVQPLTSISTSQDLVPLLTAVLSQSTTTAQPSRLPQESNQEKRNREEREQEQRKHQKFNLRLSVAAFLLSMLIGYVGIYYSTQSLKISNLATVTGTTPPLQALCLDWGAFVNEQQTSLAKEGMSAIDADTAIDRYGEVVNSRVVAYSEKLTHKFTKASGVKDDWQAPALGTPVENISLSTICGSASEYRTAKDPNAPLELITRETGP